MTGEYSVYWFDPEGSWHRERHRVDAATAVEFARKFLDRPAVKIGVVARVIITDGGDFTVFEWKRGQGITFPPTKATAP